MQLDIITLISAKIYAFTYKIKDGANAPPFQNKFDYLEFYLL